MPKGRHTLWLPNFEGKLSTPQCPEYEYVCVFTCMFVCAHVHVHVSGHIHVHVCVHMSVYVCMDGPQLKLEFFSFRMVQK